MKFRHPAGKKIAITLIITLLLASLTIPAGAATYTYDQLNRLTSVTYENGLELTYTYDAGGNITSVSHEEGTPGLTVISTVPEDQAVDVPGDQDISVVFSVYIQPGSAYDNISVQDAAYNPVDITKSIAADTLTIDPADNLAFDTRYTVTVPARSVTDMVYNHLRNNYSFIFTTITTPETVAPVVISTDPACDETGVSVDKTVTVTFSEKILTGETFDSIFFYDNDGNPVAFTKNLAGAVLTIDPVAELNETTVYTLSIPAGAVQDMFGNNLADNFTFSFTTCVSE